MLAKVYLAHKINKNKLFKPSRLLHGSSKKGAKKHQKSKPNCKHICS